MTYPDYTEEFYNWIYYDPKEVWQGSKRNRIKTRPIIVLGTSGIGKTTFVENIMKKVSQWYDNPGYGVCPVYTGDVSLGSLMEYGFRVYEYLGERWKQLPSVYVLAFDDATAVKVKPEEVRRFFSIRHIAKEYAGINEGIIYSVFLTHDWYSLDKIFRRYGDTLIVLSVSSLDDYSRYHIQRLIGKNIVQTLRELYKKASKYDKYKGVGFVKLPYIPDGQKTDVGMIRFETVDTPYIQIKLWEKPNIEVDKVDLILHVPEKKEQEMAKEEVERLLEEQKKRNRERQRKWYWKQKKKLRDSFDEA